MPIPYNLLIDWNDDGAFTGTNEDVTNDLQNNPGFSCTRGSDQLRDLAPPMAGGASFNLSNQNKTYSIENASSPIYTSLHPGHQVKLKTDYASIVFTYTSTIGHSSCYDTINGVSSYTIQSGDVLYYDVLWNSAIDFCAIDLSDTVTFLKTQGATDQLGFSSNPTTDLSSVANGTWYSRVIPLPASMNGKVITQFLIGTDTTSSAGIHTVQSLFRNIYIANSSNVVQSTIFKSFDSNPTHTTQTSTNCSSSATAIGFHLPIFTGVLDDLQQHPEPQNLDVTFPLLGNLSKLVGKTISTQLYGDGTTTNAITTDVALGYILDAVGIPSNSTWRNFDVGQTKLLWWWVNNQDAFQAASSLIFSEGPGAKLFESRSGVITFHSRSHRLTQTTSTTSQATFSNTTNEPIFSQPFTYNPGIKDIVNICTATVKTRSTKTASVIWTYGSANITFAANQVIKIIALPSGSDPFTNATSPVLSTDYTVVSGAISSISLDRTSGPYCTMTITAGSSGAVINSLQLRAQLVSVDNTLQVINTVNTSVSQTAYGAQYYTDPISTEISYGNAQDLVNGIVSIYQNPRPTVQLTLNNANWARFKQQLTREISDRITIIEPQTGVNTDYWIEQLKDKITSTVQTTTIGCEKVWTNNFFVLDVSQLDVGVLGF